MAAIGEEGDSRQLGLTNLPDEILIRILSMLPTKDAVRTCLLVLRRSGQQHLWKSLTSLDFHETTSMFSLKSDFINFVDRVMDLRDHSLPLLSFSLQYLVEEEFDDADRIERWITKAVQCNVEELILQPVDCIIDEVLMCVPTCLLGSQSLVKLHLESISFDYHYSFICLPLLKYLTLSQVKFGTGKSIEKLLSSPLLEELIMEECYWYIQSIRACSPKLQVLKISDTCNLAYGLECGGSKICIIGDNLKYFSYMGGLMNEYRICASSSTQLSKVEIYVNEEMPRRFALNCYEILKGLSGTRNLALSDYFLEGLQNSSELLDTIPIFEDLTRLNVRVYKESICIDNLALMKIYERCPHLQYLNIGKLSHAVRSPELSSIPLCFRTYLKKIVVHYYVPGDEDDAALDVFLNNALVLEELVIYCERDEEKGFHEGSYKIEELQDRLNGRPRVSEDCIISVRVTHYIDRSSASWKELRDYYDNCYLKTIGV